MPRSTLEDEITSMSVHALAERFIDVEYEGHAALSTMYRLAALRCLTDRSAAGERFASIYAQLAVSAATDDLPRV